MHLYDPLFRREGPSLIACVQTSPLPKKKSGGGGTSVHRLLISFGKRKTVSSLPLALVMIKRASLLTHLIGLSHAKR